MFLIDNELGSFDTISYDMSNMKHKKSYSIAQPISGAPFPLTRGIGVNFLLPLKVV